MLNLSKENQELRKQNEELKKLNKQGRQAIQELQSHNSNLQSANEQLKISVTYFRALVYGRKSEKLSHADVLQGRLFDEAEVHSDNTKTDKPDTSDPPSYAASSPSADRRKLKARGRKPLPKELPREIIEHDLTEQEKQCDCGQQMKRIGSETSEKLRIIPAVLTVEKHVRHKYACKHCAEIPAEERSHKAIKIAPPPISFLDKTILTASLLAHVLVNKFCDALPFYRQEKIFKRVGIEISRASMSNWTIKASHKLNRLLKLMALEALTCKLIHIDETPVQVLKELNKKAHTKSYMWVIRAGPPEKSVVLFRYRPNRKSNFLKRLLKNHKGTVLTDGYAGYNFLDKLPDAIHAGCWAHSRREFYKIKSIKGVGYILKLIGKLYHIEEQARKQNLGLQDLNNLRQTKSKPLVKEIKQWLDQKSHSVPPKVGVGKAVGYTLGQWVNLTQFLDDPKIPLDNNPVENAIRPFVIGRKNWLFSDRVKGARASAGIYSLIETAKANGLEPYWYLKYLFEQLPYAKSDNDLRKLLPNILSPDFVQDGVS